MKYGVIKVSNGAFAIESEWSDLDKAKARFHKTCETHWSAPDVKKATIMLCDENLNLIRDFKETITHEVEPTEEA